MLNEKTQRKISCLYGFIIVEVNGLFLLSSSISCVQNFVTPGVRKKLQVYWSVYDLFVITRQ